MSDRLGSTGWTVSEARGVIGRFRDLATTPAESAGIELFTALCEYLDELHGGRGFDGYRYELAPAVQQVLAREPGVVRLQQPADSAVTLRDGRELGEVLAAGTGWSGNLGTAIRELYAYLDHLCGGPGAFQALLTREERAQLVQAAPKR